MWLPPSKDRALIHLVNCWQCSKVGSWEKISKHLTPKFLVTFDLGNSYPSTTFNYFFFKYKSNLQYIWTKCYFADSYLSLLGNILNLGVLPVLVATAMHKDAHYIMYKLHYTCTLFLLISKRGIIWQLNHFFQQIMI